MAIEIMPPGQAVEANLEKANTAIQEMQGQPAEIALVHAQLAHVYATCALVAAVQDLREG